MDDERTLGRTGLRVSPIGLGLAALGRPGYINLGHGRDLAGETNVEALERRTHEVLDAAYAAGVRYLDAARSYGRAEDFLASWLDARAVPPGAVTVGSKWGYVYNSATLESGVLDDAEVRDELTGLREQGLAIGFTASGPRQRETIERALEVGGFDSVQATWNLLERSAGTALAAAHEAGLGVIVKEALANGRLIGTVPDSVAIAAVLAQPWADVVLSGAVTVEHLESNLRALEAKYDGRHDDLVEDPEAYWSARAALPWN